MNMSYCRFRNTLQDFRDCMDAIEEMKNNAFEEENLLSKEETWALFDLYDEAKNFVDGYDIDDLNNLIEEIKEIHK